MKRMIPISEYCRQSPWSIRPERIRAWCRDGIRGKRPPFFCVGGRYYLDADRFDAWLRGSDQKRRPRRKTPSAKIRAVIAREEGGE